MKAEPCGERTERGASGETPHDGLETRRADEANSGEKRTTEGTDNTEGKAVGRWCIGGRENHERHEGHERGREAGGWGVRADEGR